MEPLHRVVNTYVPSMEDYLSPFWDMIAEDLSITCRFADRQPDQSVRFPKRLLQGKAHFRLAHPQRQYHPNLEWLVPVYGNEVFAGLRDGD
ncbi:hypothetical protein FRC14_002701 [Serendipita sp. 396]|nr:hypothetical protein FRC14_002701 [Serendipita sp. 396]